MFRCYSVFFSRVASRLSKISLGVQALGFRVNIGGLGDNVDRVAGTGYNRVRATRRHSTSIVAVRRVGLAASGFAFKHGGLGFMPKPVNRKPRV